MLDDVKLRDTILARTAELQKRKAAILANDRADFMTATTMALELVAAIDQLQWVLELMETNAGERTSDAR